MANSLKATFPALSRIVGYTPAALYAKQRAYVEAGLLESTPGRGPGSGVKASPEALAEFLICLICEATLEEKMTGAKSIARAKAAGCSLTDAKTFKDAFAEILADSALLNRVTEIRIVTNGALAEIKHDRSSVCTFLGKAFDPNSMTVSVAISPETLRKLADVIGETES